MNAEAKRVDLGARYLDQTEPDWAERIDLYQIDISDDRQCIKGQLYGSYSATLSHLGGPALEAQVKEDMRLGFTPMPRWVLFNILCVYTRGHFEKQVLELRVQWYKAVQARQLGQRWFRNPLVLVA